MESNTELMRGLYARKLIRSEEPEYIYKAPPKIKADAAAVEGMLLGIAIGDALGNTSESLTTEERRNAYGLITDYLPNSEAGGKKVGLQSDDTQLSFDTVDVILEKGFLDVPELPKRFVSHEIIGIGTTVSRFVENYVDFGAPWFRAGVIGGHGNGAMMRIAPAILPFLKSGKENPWADAVLDTMLTHNGALAIGSSVGFVNLLYETLASGRLPESGMLVDHFIGAMAPFVGDERCEVRTPSAKDFPHKAPLYLRLAVEHGLRSRMTVEEFGDYFGSSGHILETDAAVLYILAKYGRKPVEAMIQAVNSTWDNDTIAAIVGAATGAAYGKSAFKGSWIDNLLGRTREDDDGKVFRTIEGAMRFLERG